MIGQIIGQVIGFALLIALLATVFSWMLKRRVKGRALTLLSIGLAYLLIVAIRIVQLADVQPLPDAIGNSIGRPIISVFLVLALATVYERKRARRSNTVTG